jgi:hypothetical protein
LIPFDTIGGFNKTIQNSFKRIDKLKNTLSSHDTIKNEILSIVQKKNKFNKFYLDEDHNTQEDTSDNN